MNEGTDYRRWRAPDPRCVFLLVHGLGTYVARWEAMANFFQNKGASSYAVNLPRLPGMSDYYNQILSLKDIAIAENPGKKVFLVGESLGALASFLIVVRNPGSFAGLICISPAFAGKRPVKFRETIKIVSALFYRPTKKIDLPFDSSMCTRDKYYRNKLNKDPLEYRTASARLVVDILIAQMKAKAVSKDLKDSVLFLIAGADTIVDSAVSRKVFDDIGSSDKTFLEFPEMYHALSIELGKENMFEELLGWVNNRL